MPYFSGRRKTSSASRSRRPFLEPLEERACPDATIWDQDGLLVVVNDDALSNAAEITIHRDGVPVATGDRLQFSTDVDPGTAFDFRQVFVFDTNNVARLLHPDGNVVPAQADNFGTSFEPFGGIVLDDGSGGALDFLGAVVSRIDLITVESAKGILKLEVTARPADGPSNPTPTTAPVLIRETITILPAMDELAVVSIAGSATFEQTLTLNATSLANAEAFRVLEFDSSNVPDANTSPGVPATHDADEVRLTDAYGREIAILDLTNQSANTLFWPGGQNLSLGGWLEVNQVNEAPLNGDPPNVKGRVLSFSPNTSLSVQGFKTVNPGIDENDDNVGVWINANVSQIVQAGTVFTWNSQVAASDELPANERQLTDALQASEGFTVIGATGSPTTILAVKIFDATGNFVDTVEPFDNLTSLRVATGDFDGDGKVDEFAVLGRRTNSDLRAEIVVYELGMDGRATETGRFFAFDPGILGNGFITVGDFDGDGDDDIAVAQIGGGRAVVTLQVHTSAGGTFSMAASTIVNFGIISAPRIAAGDTDGDGVAEIVVAAKTPAGARVLVFDADTGVLNQQGAGFVWDFGVAGYARGAFVAVGEFAPTHSGEEIVLGSNVGGGGRLDIVSYDGVGAATLVADGRLTPFGSDYTAAVRVAVGQLVDRNVIIAGQDRFRDGMYVFLARDFDASLSLNPPFEFGGPVTALSEADGLAPASPNGNRTLGPFVAFANTGLAGVLGSIDLIATLLSPEIELSLIAD